MILSEVLLPYFYLERLRRDSNPRLFENFEAKQCDYASTNSVENTSPGVQLCIDFREGGYVIAFSLKQT